MTVRARYLRAAGAIVDGYSRDTNGMLALDFPIFSRGAFAQDQGVRGYVVDYRQPIQFAGGPNVTPGDLIFGDRDGIVVVPQDAETEVLALANEKVFGESTVRQALENGMPTREAFRTYGIM